MPAEFAISIAHRVQCLHCKKVCIVALAFVVWQMSIEGVSNIEAFRTSEHKASILRLMGPSRNTIVLPLEGYLRWSFYGFFELVVELKRICTQYRRDIIEQVPYHEHCQGFLLGRANF